MPSNLTQIWNSFRLVFSNKECFELSRQRKDRGNEQNSLRGTQIVGLFDGWKEMRCEKNILELIWNQANIWKTNKEYNKKAS